MDVAQKKQEVLESIANQPLNVVYIRVDICNQIQLADLMKEDFIPYLRGAARTVSGGTSGRKNLFSGRIFWIKTADVQVIK